MRRVFFSHLTHLKHKLIERYDNHIILADVCGHKNIVCFRNMCSFILNNKCYVDRETDVDVESKQLLCQLLN